MDLSSSSDAPDADLLSAGSGGDLLAAAARLFGREARVFEGAKCAAACLSQEIWRAAGYAVPPEDGAPEKYIHKEDLAALELFWSQTHGWRSDTTYTNRFRLRAASGGWLPCELRAVLVRDAVEGSGPLFYGTARPYAELSDAFKAQILDQLPCVAILLRQTADEVVWANEKGRNLPGYNQPMIERLMQQPYKSIHPEDRVALRRKIRRMKPGESGEMQVRATYATQEQEWHWLALQLLALDMDGETVVFSFHNDITESREAGERLRERGELFERIAALAPLNIYLNDVETGANIWQNRDLHALLGYTKREWERLDHRKLTELIHPEDLLDFRDRQPDAAAPGEARETLFRARHKDGSWRWVLSRATVFERDEQGRPVKILGAAQDVTPQKENEAELARQLHFVKQIADYAPTGIFLYDPAEKAFVWLNRAARELLGAPAYGPFPLAAFAQCLRPEEDGAALDAVAEARESVWREFRFQFCLRDKNRDWRYYYSRAAPFREPDSNAPLALGFLLDESEERKAYEFTQKQFNFLSKTMESVPAVLCIFDFKVSQAVWVNTQTEPRLGYHRAEWLAKTGDGLAEIIHPEDRGFWRQLLDLYREGRDLPEADASLRLLHKTEGWQWKRLHITPLGEGNESNGRAVRALIFIHDETAPGRSLPVSSLEPPAEAVPNERAANPDAFVNALSHEIRNQLYGVVGAARLLSETALSEDQARLAAPLASASKRLLVFLEDYLDFMRDRRGGLSLREESVPLKTVAEELNLALVSQMTARNCSLTVNIEENAPETLYCDPTRLSQILTNLVGNAVDHLKNAEIVIEIKRLEAPDWPECEGGAIEFVVSDDGPGFDPEKTAPWLNAPIEELSFDQLPESGGLGLFISRRLARLMGGELRIESRPGLGTTARLRLPLREQENAIQSALAPMLQDAKPLPKPGELRVLLVEDDVLLQLVNQRMLALMGFAETQIAPSAAEALEVLGQAPFDVVLTDLNMPGGMSGFELARALRRSENERLRNLPVVGVSADASPETEEAALNAGIDALLPRPLDEQTFLRTLGRLMRR